MSHVRTSFHAPKVHAASSRTKTFYGILIAATVAVAIASLMATALSGGPAAASEPQAAAVPLASVPLAEPPGTSVPDAGTVLNGKDMPADEPAPTF